MQTSSDRGGFFRPAPRSAGEDRKLCFMAERLTTPTLESAAWTVPAEFWGIMAYNPRHDIQDYLDLANLNGKIPSEDYAQLLIQTNARTQRNLEKTIGERFRVRSSQIEYFVKDGKLQNPDYPEPVIKRYEKGRRFLEESGSTETERETADVSGIRQVEDIFAHGRLKDGQKVVVASPQGPEGTLYDDNYFDVYEPKDGKITMSRYHSTHNLEGFFKAIQTADPSIDRQQPEELSSAYFLQRPIVTSLAIDKILETFALDVNTQLEKDQEKIIEACMPFIQYYIRVLAENPLGFEEIKKAINTIYNVADEAENELIAAKQETVSLKFQQFQDQTAKAAVFADIMQAVNFYGTQPVRTVSSGCPGGQKGFTINQPSLLRSLSSAIGARSVVDFAPFLKTENEDTSDFPCPRCGYIITYGAGIKKCPGCSLEATCG